MEFRYLLEVVHWAVLAVGIVEATGVVGWGLFYGLFQEDATAFVAVSLGAMRSLPGLTSFMFWWLYYCTF